MPVINARLELDAMLSEVMESKLKVFGSVNLHGANTQFKLI